MTLLPLSRQIQRMKLMYLPELTEIYQRVASKVQHVSYNFLH